jgi:hypothetical protein
VAYSPSDLFDLMNNIRQNPRCIAELTGLDLDLEDEPRNITRDLKGTRSQGHAREFVILWGFGKRGRLTKIVGVVFEARKPGSHEIRKEILDAVAVIEGIYGVECIVTDVSTSTSHLN